FFHRIEIHREGDLPGGGRALASSADHAAAGRAGRHEKLALTRCRERRHGSLRQELAQIVIAARVLRVYYRARTTTRGVLIKWMMESHYERRSITRWFRFRPRPFEFFQLLPAKLLAREYRPRGEIGLAVSPWLEQPSSVVFDQSNRPLADVRPSGL